jgi:mRNA deadenylase 3'-5' endonuclease subunit Ccr4
LILILQPKGGNEKSQICVATTHIFWNPKYEDVKIRQALLLLHKIEEFWQRKDRLIVCGGTKMRASIKKKFPRYQPNWMICDVSDFNSTPDSAMYQLMRSGSIDVTEWDGDLGGRGFGKPSAGLGRKLCDLASFDMKAKVAGMTDPEKSQYKHVFSKLDKVYRKLFMEMSTPVLRYERHLIPFCVPSLLTDDFVRHPFRFESAYQFYNMYTDENVNTVDERVVERWTREAQEGRGEPVTSFFSRFRGCIDYIFISSDCQTTQYVQLPGKLALDAMRGLPTLTWPSDHLLVGAELRFLTEGGE